MVGHIIRCLKVSITTCAEKGESLKHRRTIISDIVTAQPGSDK